jgi:hypothetical protein
MAMTMVDLLEIKRQKIHYRAAHCTRI